MEREKGGWMKGVGVKDGKREDDERVHERQRHQEQINKPERERKRRG